MNLKKKRRRANTFQTIWNRDHKRRDDFFAHETAYVSRVEQDCQRIHHTSSRKEI